MIIILGYYPALKSWKTEYLKGNVNSDSKLPPRDNGMEFSTPGLIRGVVDKNADRTVSRTLLPKPGLTLWNTTSSKAKGVLKAAQDISGPAKQSAGLTATAQNCVLTSQGKPVDAQV